MSVRVDHEMFVGCPGGDRSHVGADGEERGRKDDRPGRGRTASATGPERPRQSGV